MATTFQLPSLRVLVASALLIGSTASPATEMTMVPGTDLMGGDYKGFALTSAEPDACRQACAGDDKCKAYTYVNPGVKGPAAMCYLKDSLPAVSSDACCTSGKKILAIKITPAPAPPPAPKPPGPPGSSSSQPSGNTPIVLGNIQKVGTKPLTLVKLPPGITFTAKGDMSGWTPLTNGATSGGASVVQLTNGEGRVVVRAADKKLYMANMNLLNPGTIDTAAWTALQGGLQPGAESEAHCMPNESEKDADTDLACAFLDTGGSVSLMRIKSSGWNDRIKLGGQNAGGRPTLMGYFHPADFAQSAAYYDVLAWDGGMVAYRLMHASAEIDAGPGAYGADWPVGWQKMASAMATPVGCTKLNFCAAGTLGDKVVMFGVNQPPKLTVSMLGGQYVSPTLPGGLSMNIAPSPLLLSEDKQVFVRSKNGHIYRWRVKAVPAKWDDMGGDAMAGASINCRANNEQPMCFIQGSDGKVYWRKFDSPAGL